MMYQVVDFPKHFDYTRDSSKFYVTVIFWEPDGIPKGMKSQWNWCTASSIDVTEDTVVVFHLRYNAKSTWQRYCEHMSVCT